MSRLRLNVGCGHAQMAGWVNVDRLPLPGVDVLWDLDEYPWPWEDGQACEIRAWHIVEHLNSGFIAFCNECWRLLTPTGTRYAGCQPGTLLVEVPDAADPDLAWCDPYHVRPYRVGTFTYVTPGGIAHFGYTDRPWSLVDVFSDNKVVRVRMVPLPKGAP